LFSTYLVLTTDYEDLPCFTECLLSSVAGPMQIIDIVMRLLMWLINNKPMEAQVMCLVYIWHND